jgi:hypothetical protein
MRLLRSLFGSCKDRWFHDWVVHGEVWYGRQKSGEPGPQHECSRICRICGKKEYLHYLSCIAGDGEPNHSWRNYK